MKLKNVKRTIDIFFDNITADELLAISNKYGIVVDELVDVGIIAQLERVVSSLSANPYNTPNSEMEGNIATIQLVIKYLEKLNYE